MVRNNIIESINLDSLSLLLLECKRLLKDNGLLVLQTPSRYNLSTSSSLLNTNPDLFAFELGKIGFNGIQTFYIHKPLLEYEDKYSLTRILNGLAQDLVIIATRSKNSTLNLTKNSLWKTSLKSGFNAIKAAKEYDNQLRIRSINKEESIHQLTERILLLERTIEAILNSRFYRITVIISKLFHITYSKIKAIKISFMMIFLKLIRFFISVVYKIVNQISLKNSSFDFFISKFLDRILRNFGYRLRYGKVLRKSSRKKEDIDLILFDILNLDLHYDTSPKSKVVFKDLK